MAVKVSAQFEDLYPGGSRSATECAMNLVRVGDHVVGRVAAILRAFDLTPAGGLVLSILAEEQNPLAPHEIGERLIVTRATVTGLIDSLEHRGCVRRTPHPHDGRMYLVELTPRGRRLAHQFRPVVHERERVWFEALTEDERGILLQLLGRIQQRLSALPPEGSRGHRGEEPRGPRVGPATIQPARARPPARSPRSSARRGGEPTR